MTAAAWRGTPALGAPSALRLAALTVVTTVAIAGAAAADRSSAAPVPARIAFTRGDPGEIYVMNADGSGQANLSNDPSTDGSPDWSPDGAKIAFGTSRANDDIYVMNADGSAQTNVTNNAAFDVQPDWSPDGSKIAFATNRGTGDNFEIFLMNADGSGQTNLTNNAAGDSQPAWSPDGTKIAFSTPRGAGVNHEIFVMNADGSNQTNLTNSSAADLFPAWSPDGSKIAFATNRGTAGNFEIFVMNADGTGQTNLTNSPASDGSPAWSPDGTQIAFSTDRGTGGNSEIFVMNADGTAPTNVTNNAADDGEPDWAGAAPSPPPTTFVLAGYGQARAGAYNILTGTNLTATRGYVLNPANFGPAGTVPVAYELGPAVSDATAAALSGVDVFFTGWVHKDWYGTANGADDKQVLRDFVLGGGALIATTDDTQHTMVDVFGLTQGDGSGNPTANTVTNTSHSLPAGPFGTVTSYNQYQLTGHYPSLGADAIEIGRNVRGVSLAVIERGKLGPGSGPVVFVADVDVFTNNTQGATVNATLIKNIFAFVTKLGSTTVITSDAPDPSARGQEVTVLYSVTPSGGGGGAVPTGTVTVTDGVDSCTATVAAGRCTLTLTTVGARTLSARYAGDARFNGSTSAGEPHTVEPALTTTAITSDAPDPSVHGQEITVAYSVTPSGGGAGTPTGNVTVTDGVESCTGTVAAGSCTLRLTTVGARTLTATYAGDANFATSTSPGEPHTVHKAATVTAITSDAPDPSVKGEAVTVAFTAAALSPGAGTPSGTVVVSDGVQSCSASVAAGQCSLALTTVGARTLRAVYEGDMDFEGSTSGDEPHIVTKVPTTTSIVSDSPDPSRIGEAVTIRFTVRPTAGSGNPTGNVTVGDGVASCAATVAEGVCELTFTTAGQRTLTARYEGDADFAASASPNEPHTVGAAGTTTAITSDTPDPSVRGQETTVAYSVTPSGGGAGLPTGNVTVTDGVDSCTGTVAAGGCTLRLTTVGERTLTATYAGDAHFAASTSPGMAHTVNKAATVTAITSDAPDPSARGQEITVAYTVTVVAPGAGTPTGNVTVSDGVESCTGTVAAGSCTLRLTTAGTRTLTAIYAGDAGFESSRDDELHTGEPDAADVVLTKSASTRTPALGNDFAYTIVVANRGPATATSVTVVDDLSSDLRLVLAPPGCTGTARITCSLGNLAAGSSATITLVVEARFRCDFVGTSGNDRDGTIGSSPGEDVICGGGGADTIRGGGGNDMIYGLAPPGMLPANVVNAAEATSLTPDPSPGNNTGSVSLTVVAGTDGGDRLFGGNGNDGVLGQAGGDTIHGDPGADRIFGGVGADNLQGEAGDDVIFGDEGADTMYGEADEDRMNGGDGNDTINGGDGADRLQGVYGNDVVNGGGGADMMWGDSNATVYGGIGAGNDTMRGNGGDDTIMGQDGRDLLEGGVGDDDLFGGTGNDTLHGNTGQNSLDCGTGTDRYSFAPSRDRQTRCEVRI